MTRLTATRVVRDSDVPTVDEADAAREDPNDLTFWSYYRDQLRGGVPIGAVGMAGLLWLEGAPVGEVVGVSAVVAVVGMPLIVLPRAWSRWWRDRRDRRALAEATAGEDDEPDRVADGPDVAVRTGETAGVLPTGTIKLGSRVESGSVIDYDRSGLLRKAWITASFALFGLVFALAAEGLADTPGEVPFLRSLGIFIIVVFIWKTIWKVSAAIRGWVVALTATELIHGPRGRPTRVAWRDVVDTEVFAKHGNALLGVQLTDYAEIHGPWTTRIAARNRSLFTRWDLVIPLEDLTVPSPQLVEAIDRKVQRSQHHRSPNE